MAAAGVAAAVISGLANGSWNLPTKKDAPNVVCAVRGDWQWENIWFASNLMMPVVNTAVVCGVVGPSTLRDIYAVARPSEVLSIVGFSILWGFGGVGFGQAIKRVGIALGTSVVMGIIVVIGTALPAVMEASRLSATQSAGAAAGVILGILGFSMGSKAASLKEKAVGSEANAGVASLAEVRVGVALNAKAEAPADLLSGAKGDRDTSGAEGSGRRSFVESILWCLMGGVMSSMLQFAFVFGGNLVDIAKDNGVPKEAAAMPIWLLCFIFNAIGHLLYSSYLLRTNGTWRAFSTTPLRDSAHSTCLSFLMAVGLPFHIHLYGVGAVLMGDTGAVFAWPVRDPLLTHSIV